MLKYSGVNREFLIRKKSEHLAFMIFVSLNATFLEEYEIEQNNHLFILLITDYFILEFLASLINANEIFLYECSFYLFYVAFYPK